MYCFNSQKKGRYPKVVLWIAARLPEPPEIPMYLWTLLVHKYLL